MTDLREPSALVLDIDGTLCDYDTLVPDSAARALRAAREHGHEVFACTGRGRAEMYQHLWDLGLDGMIGGNGSYVEHHLAVVHHQVLPVDLVEEAVVWLDEHQRAYYLECNQGLFGSHDMLEATAHLVGKDLAWARGVFPDMILDPTRGHDDVNKISFIMGADDDLDELRDMFDGRAAIGSWSANTDPDQFGEIGQLGISKDVGVHALAEHLGRDTSGFIGFGDARSDLPMMRACGLAVAMGQAPDEVKAAADLVTAPVDEDGLAQAFVALGIIPADAL